MKDERRKQMEGINKEVYFYKYCKLCRYKDTDENQQPCDECLSEPVNINCHRPVKFEAIDEGKDA